jgi:ribonuclease G
MQSAFVDVGLERDAFLYVTDFLELEDQEESDEIEKAAVSGGNQAPREVRHSNAPESNGGARTPRSGQRPDQGTDQRQDRRPDRPARTPQISVEAVPGTNDASQEDAEPSFTPHDPSDAKDESGDPAAKRWRGRRRRRGGRGGDRDQGASTSSSNQQESDSQDDPQPFRESTNEPSIPAAGFAPRTASAASSQASVPFVMPGESLSKYGGTNADDSSKAASTFSAPPRPASTFKPSTMIESPLEWDGSGLLPGESLSKHRNRGPELGAEVDHHTIHAEPFQDFGAPDEIEEEDLVSERSEAAPQTVVEDDFAQDEVLEEELTESQSSELEPFEDDQFEDSIEPAPQHVAEKSDDYTVVQVFEQPSADETVADAVVRQDKSVPSLGSKEPLPARDEPAEPEADASASHHVDPLPPTGFRLFGLGGKRKTEPSPAPPPEAPKASAVAASSYAPGSGLIEEEVIEEEEFDAPHHHHKADEHDLEDYEEETLPNQIRSGDLGEMLQEAHLDHKIQLNFDDRNGRGGRRGRGGPGQSQGNRGGRGGPSRRNMQTSDLPIISDLLKPGQEILVQIAKEPIAKKGARITSHIALPGRFLVFMPTVGHVGVSRKIASDEERQRLKRILTHERGEASGGFIVRTAAEGASEEELRSDLRFLIHLWDEIKTRSDNSKSPALIYHDLSLIERILRDQVSSNFSSIWVDSQEDYERIVRFLNRFSPNLVRRVKLYTKETPLFEHFGIQDEISKALRSKVWLKSGGSIVINQTEALVAIDINTGKYVGKSARLEDTIVKTNLDAVPEIVRQIRLRDLGGIIVIDFIDMDDRKNRFRVMAALEEALKADRAPTKVLQFNDFGLVAITRKRVKQSLERTLSVPCPTCQATGMVKSPTTVCNEIYTELRKMKKHFEGADVLIRVNPETVKVLKSNNASWLTEFEELVGKNILVKSDATLHPEQFDIQG